MISSTGNKSAGDTAFDVDLCYAAKLSPKAKVIALNSEIPSISMASQLGLI